MQVLYKSTPHTRKFGVELEVSPDIHKQDIAMYLKEYELYRGTNREVRVTDGERGWKSTNLNDYWHVKFDSTCGPLGKPHDFGWEVASFIGSTAADLNTIGDASQWLAKRNIKTNHNCGYHVHVDVSDFTPEQMGLLLARWLKIEFCVMASCPIRRLNNPYCQLLNLRRIMQGVEYDPSALKQFWNEMAPQNLNEHDNPDKRYTVNTIGYRIGQTISDHPRKTVEFRFPEGSLDKDHVVNWVRFLLCFVDACYQAPISPDDIQKTESVLGTLNLVGLQNESIFYLLDQDLLDTKIWFLNKIISANYTSSYAPEASELLAFITQI